MRSWLKWGIPLAIVVLLGAAGGGVLLSQYVYRDAFLAQRSDASPEPDGKITSPLGIVYTPDAAIHPDQPNVQALLDNHFRSINDRSYDLWKSTVVPSKWLELPKDKWVDSYGTTRDFGWTVQRIDPGPDGSLLVMLTFMSNQAPEDAPPQAKSTCVTWNVVYPLVLDETRQGLRLDTSKLPNSALFKPCK
ncbi:hypothetical protein AB0I53_47395 [Saccharopolyspora sp. NPDC050389]|uniref:hypothetical protein n=1 Tax=Saccharopolyspora sp. NPDC050389 TaxID=3155516 RepID=UPI0033E766F0